MTKKCPALGTFKNLTANFKQRAILLDVTWVVPLMVDELVDDVEDGELLLLAATDELETVEFSPKQKNI